MTGQAARRGATARIFALGCLLASVFAVGASAQGVRYDNIVLGPRGTPVAAAQIAVCTAAATRTTTPCSPLAQIYSDQALTQPVANPFSADSLGNYGFWAQPGHYVVQIYGNGVTTRSMDVFLACDPSNCSMTSATFSTITAGTLNLTGALTVNGRSVATEPLPNDAVQFVSPNGNDSNNGLSWGSAVADIYTAWNNLYSLTPSGGTIYVAPNSSCGSAVAGMGIWSMNAGDPNWNGGNVPPGWVKDMPVRIIGVGTPSYIGNSPVASVPVNCGSSTSPNLPSVWISGNNGPKQFDNLIFNGAYQAMRLGIDSNGVRDTNTGAVSLTFNNDQFSRSSNAAGGPTIDIGSNVFNIYFNNDLVQAGYGTPGTDQYEAMVINGGGGSCHQPGLIHIRNMHINNGDIKYYTNECENGGSLYINGLLTEDQNDGHGAVWLTAESGSGFYDIQNVAVADAVAGTQMIEVDPQTAGTVQNPDSLITNFEVPGVPGTFVGGGDSLYYSTMAQEPSAWSQYGFLFGKVWGQSDAGRRLFGPTESPWPNLAAFLPSAWQNATETDVPDPTGTNFAGQATGQPYFADLTQTFNAGDFIVVGAWYRVPVKTGTIGANAPVSLGFLGSGGCRMQPVDQSSAASPGFPVGQEGSAGDGQWVWASGAFVISSGGSCNLVFQANMYNTATGVIFYAPVMYVIPQSSVSSYSDVADVTENLAPYAYGLPAGADATLPGHPIAFGGTGDDYLATLDHTALTANQTYTLPAAGGAVGVVLGQATVAGPTAAIAGGACATTVTAALAGVTGSTAILASPAADPAAANYKSLVVHWFPTAGNVNLEVCNPSSSSITPGALSFNVRAIE
ncbi:MAG TPA: hypothetical protein VNJ12_06650 [Candidatus Dormibacteraeota bacterium]|nr:hypothetical protein [Candidatus Dormibacteraeota bacterium]